MLTSCDSKTILGNIVDNRLMHEKEVKLQIIGI